MRWSQGKNNRISFNERQERRFDDGGAIQHRTPGTSKLTQSIRGIRYFYAGLVKCFVAFKYLFFRVNSTWLTKSNVLWLKIGVAGFAILMVMRNDFQFTINFSGEGARITPSEKLRVDHLGVAQSISIKSPQMRKPEKQKKTSRNLTKKHLTKVKARKVAITSSDVDAYITEYTELAKKEMYRFGIPASLKMAQAILASQAGKDLNTLSYNNHFGRHLKGVDFDSDWSNWRAHSLYLIENYPELLDAGSDYLDWIKVLGQTNYGVNQENYTRDLISVIKEYKLYQLDY